MRCFKVGNYFREDEESATVPDFAKDPLIGNAVRSLFIVTQNALIR
jgi:hypothetical protein